MVARSKRLKHQSAVMLIDIINVKQIQRDYGSKVADELPLRVASRLLSNVREIDSAASLSERRFGMLIESPLSDASAASIGPRIVARCLMPYQGLHPECVAQVHVAYALVPYQGNSSQSLLSRLENRLALAVSSDDKPCGHAGIAFAFCVLRFAFCGNNLLWNFPQLRPCCASWLWQVQLFCWQQPAWQAPVPGRAPCWTWMCSNNLWR